MATITVYRADTGRERIERNGFTPRATLTLEQTRDLIRVMTGVCALRDAHPDLQKMVPTKFAIDDDVGFKMSFKSSHGRDADRDDIRAHDLARTNRDPQVLMQWVVSSGSGIMPHTSLAKTEDCGGYNNGTRYVFKAEVTGVEERSWRDAVGVRQRATANWPKLWMDHAQLAHASIVAIEQVQDAKEVTFFTPIPPASITLIFQPAVQPAAKTPPVGAGSGSLKCACGTAFPTGVKLRMHQLGCQAAKAAK